MRLHDALVVTSCGCHTPDKNIQKLRRDLLPGAPFLKAPADTPHVPLLKSHDRPHLHWLEPGDRQAQISDVQVWSMDSLMVIWG